MEDRARPRDCFWITECEEGTSLGPCPIYRQFDRRQRRCDVLIGKFRGPWDNRSTSLGNPHEHRVSPGGTPLVVYGSISRGCPLTCTARACRACTLRVPRKLGCPWRVPEKLVFLCYAHLLTPICAFFSARWPTGSLAPSSTTLSLVVRGNTPSAPWTHGLGVSRQNKYSNMYT